MKKMIILLLCFTVFANIMSAGENPKQIYEKKLTDFITDVKNKDYNKIFEQNIEITYKSKFNSSKIKTASKDKKAFIKDIQYIFSDAVIDDIPDDFSNKLREIINYPPYEGYYVHGGHTTIIITASSYTGSSMYLDVVSSLYPMPSFSCAKASNLAEKEICKNASLSNLDNELNQEYILANKNLVYGLNDLHKTQYDFLKERNRCRSDAKCLSSIMDARVKELKVLTERASENNISLADIDYTIPKLHQKIQGKWKFEKLVYAANCGGEEVVELTIQNITIQNTQMQINFKSGQQLQCNIKREPYLVNSWAYLSKFNNMYQENEKIGNILSFDYGSCGGDVNLLPYIGVFIVMETDHCGKFVITGHQLDRLVFPQIIVFDKKIDFYNDFDREVTYLKKSHSTLEKGK